MISSAHSFPIFVNNARISASFSFHVSSDDSGIETVTTKKAVPCSQGCLDYSSRQILVRFRCAVQQFKDFLDCPATVVVPIWEVNGCKSACPLKCSNRPVYVFDLPNRRLRTPIENKVECTGEAHSSL